jgi:regulatory protein
LSLKIEVQPKVGQKDILTLLVDGEPWKELHIAVYGRNPKLPQCQTMTQWIEAFSVYEYKRGKNYLLRRLNAQAYHSLQLQKLMLDRLLTPAIVSKLIREALTWGLMDDQAWLESFIRTQKKRHGLPVILAKLKMKGFSPDLLQEIKEDFSDSNAEVEMVQNLLNTKYRSKDITQFTIKQKVIASLMRRGYSYSSIQTALMQT